MTQNSDEAQPLAVQLDAQNRERQQLTLDTVEKSRQVVLDDKAQQPLYFVAHPDFNAGIVGLAASRIGSIKPTRCEPGMARIKLRKSDANRYGTSVKDTLWRRYVWR